MTKVIELLNGRNLYYIVTLYKIYAYLSVVNSKMATTTEHRSRAWGTNKINFIRN
jgi:hypothetical protein